MKISVKGFPEPIWFSNVLDRDGFSCEKSTNYGGCIYRSHERKRPQDLFYTLVNVPVISIAKVKAVLVDVDYKRLIQIYTREEIEGGFTHYNFLYLVGFETEEESIIGKLKFNTSIREFD